jgi:hypothetical protein
MLSDTHVDEERSVMHQVISLCSAETLALLSAVSRWHHKHCAQRLHLLHAQHVIMEHSLSCHLGYLQLEQLEHIRALTIPDNLPEHLRPRLGKWLRSTGRLSRVSCVRCESWVRTGEIIPWFDLAPIRAGVEIPQTGAVLLERYDTADSLLKAVLSHAQSVIRRVRLVYNCAHPASKN